MLAQPRARVNRGRSDLDDRFSIRVLRAILVEMPRGSPRPKRLILALGLAALAVTVALTSGWWSGALIASEIAPGTTLDGRLPNTGLDFGDWLAQQ